MFTDDVENVNSTHKGRDILLANKPRILRFVFLSFYFFFSISSYYYTL